MSRENPMWGAPRILGELQMLSIDIPQATVAKYMIRRRKPPSQTWRTFLDNHVRDLASIDFFTVPTVTFRILGDAGSGGHPSSQLSVRPRLRLRSTCLASTSASS